MPRCFVIHPGDNVATLLEDCAPGPVELIGPSAARLSAGEPIALGHKISLRDIARGEEIFKYGVPIGIATETIPAGAWVHTHNCRSRRDTHSAGLLAERDR